MPLTLTDEQVAILRGEREQWMRDKAVRESAEAIWNDPALSDDAKALWKRKFPDAQIGDYDLKKEIFGRLDREKAEREEADKTAREKELDENIAKKRKAVKEKHNFTDDAMKRLEDMMTERNVGDYEVAAHWLASQEPAPSDGDAGYDRHFWQYEKQPDYQDIAKDPEGYGRREILRTLREMQARGQR